MSEKIGRYFTYSELTNTNTGLENRPFTSELNNLLHLVQNILDPLRDLYGKPIHINSAYRSPIVNSKVGGASTSHHIKGSCADITSNDNGLLFQLIKDNFEFRQLIWEKGDNKNPQWIHVEWLEGDNKKEILKFDGKKYIVIK